VALADAARCYEEAGEIERARELALRINSEAPELALPPHVSAMLTKRRQFPAPRSNPRWPREEARCPESPSGETTPTSS